MARVISIRQSERDIRNLTDPSLTQELITAFGGLEAVNAQHHVHPIGRMEIANSKDFDKTLHLSNRLHAHFPWLRNTSLPFPDDGK